MSKLSKPIGVFDSGVGGLSVLRHLVRILPNEQYVYLGDTARVPYGNKSEETIQEYTRQAVKFLLQIEAKLIIIACNTASALALQIAEELSDIPIIGMIHPAAKAAAISTKNGKIGIIGTRATIGSKAYPQVISQFQSNKTFEVYGKACPLLVPLAEEGFHEHVSTELIIQEYLTSLQSEDIDTLVLGCTHYPLLAPLIQKQMPNATLIDCGEYAAFEAQTILSLSNRINSIEHIITPTKIDFYLTDSTPLFPEIAERFLGFLIESPTRINLE
ncbi:MAG: glutamate racemase [Bacteroidetes bacterium]|nr:glutamate racemase [Bacteroidota bacterium]